MSDLCSAFFALLGFKEKKKQQQPQNRKCGSVGYVWNCSLGWWGVLLPIFCSLRPFYTHFCCFIFIFLPFFRLTSG